MLMIMAHDTKAIMLSILKYANGKVSTNICNISIKK